MDDAFKAWVRTAGWSCKWRSETLSARCAEALAGSRTTNLLNRQIMAL